ncbi:MAG: Gfo/Idh/MocA family oxidoreductase [Nitrospirae bacterium]|nr:Gfo/Idh/MocA family oxidoreductase [Nitrospirota bacterium]
MINLGVIGFGYWGPNIVRNFNSIEGVKVSLICDKNQPSINRAKKAYPHIEITTDCSDILESPNIDAIAVITPVSTHFELAKKALQNGKHVFVEKPFTATVSEAEALIELAEKKNLTIMVDHTFIFTGAVKKIKHLIHAQELGDLYYYDSIRVNLGLFQSDINVIWDLAPHDFAIMDFLISEKPVAITANAKAHVNGFEDTAYITAHFNNNMIAHFNVNWLSPVKVRTTLIGGEKKMLVWNDTEPDEKIKIYDRGVEVKSKEGVYNLLVSYRSGDMWVPKVEQTEALKIEAEYFIRCISNNERPINDGYAGLRVVNMLEACDKSLKNNGQMINICDTYQFQTMSN